MITLEKIFGTCKTDRGFLFTLYEIFLQNIKQKIKTPVEECTMDTNTQSIAGHTRHTSIQEMLKIICNG